MRLLMTTDAVGGVWTYALGLVRELSRRDVETSLAVLGPRLNPVQAAAAHAIDGLNLIETDLPLDWTARSPAEVRDAGRTIAALASRIDVDLVQLNSPSLAADALFEMPVIGVCHSCVASWWQAVRYGPMPDEFQWRTELLADGYARCDLLVAPTAAFAAATASLYGIAAPLVVRNGRTPPPASTASTKEKFVFTSGRLWDAGKNIAALDQAATALEVPVYAAGPVDGPTGERIDLSTIQPVGCLDEGDMQRWLARAPIYVAPALYEPFGLGVLEAAQAGCALILSDIPSFRELWDGAAIFVDPHNPHAIAAAIEILLDHEPLTRERGAAAARRAARYTVSAMAESMMEAYQGLPQVTDVPVAAEPLVAA